MCKVEIKDLDLFYDDFQALKEREPANHGAPHHRVHRPVRLREIHADQDAQPHERFDSQICRITGSVTLDGEDIYGSYGR